MEGSLFICGALVYQVYGNECIVVHDAPKPCLSSGVFPCLLAVFFR